MIFVGDSKKLIQVGMYFPSWSLLNTSAVLLFKSSITGDNDDLRPSPAPAHEDEAAKRNGLGAIAFARAERQLQLSWELD